MSSADSFVASTLCLGGLDPSGGAGLTLDAAVINSLGMHVLPVATATAVQSAREFIRVAPAEPALVREQLEMVESEFSVGAVKLGMLGSPEVGRVVAGWLRDRPRLPMVLDPVLRTSSGGSVGGTSFLSQEVLPLARVVTPNLDEAAALTGLDVDTRSDMEAAAAALRERGAQWALVKGGHLSKGDAADYLEGPETRTWLVKPRSRVGSVRGTGCALASVLAARLAQGDSVPEASAAAKEWVERAIAGSYAAGGHRLLGFGRKS